MSICLTAGEQSENHVGMEINGAGLARKGFSVKSLKKFADGYGGEFHLFENPEEGEPDGAVVIFRDGLSKIFSIDPDKLMEEQLSFEWDKKYWDRRRSRVQNKVARYNVCYGEEGQEPDYEDKKGTIIGYDSVPLLKSWRNRLDYYFGKKAKNLEVEGNYYYSSKKCGIGYHGDGERKIVTAASLGEARPISWQWYKRSKKIGDPYSFLLNHGDIYIMSEKATGSDWLKKVIPTLRHAAGDKYV